MSLIQNLVRDTVATFTEGRADEASYAEGLNQARMALEDMVLGEDKQFQHIQPDSCHLGDLLEAFCAPPGSKLYNKYGQGAIERAVREGNMSEVTEAITGAGDFNTLFTKLIHAQFIPQYNEQVDSIMPLFTEMPADNQIQFMGGLIDVDLPNLTREGQAAAEGKPREKYVEIENYKVTRLTGITEETVLFDKTGGQIMQRVRDLGMQVGALRRVWVITRIQDAAFTSYNFNLAANTTLKYGGSTAAVFSSDHSAIDGQTNDNTGSGSTITTPNMQTADNLLANMTDFHGRKLNLSGSTLLVPRTLRFAAAEIANSTQKFDSGDNAVNPIRVLGLIDNIVSDANVTAATWYYGDFKMQYVWTWVQRPRTDALGPDLRHGIMAQFRTWFHGGFGARDYRTVVKMS